MLSEQDLAYIAGILEVQGCVSVRVTRDGTELAQVSVSGTNADLLSWLGSLTGVKPVVTERRYSKAGCAEHCRDRHVHVVSVSGRWLVSGAKATVVLSAALPYLRWRREEAAHAVALGLAAPFKPATPNKMRQLGWPLPDGWR